MKKDIYKRFLIILKAIFLRKESIHTVMNINTGYFILFFFLIDISLLFLGDIILGSNTSFLITAHMLKTDMKNIIIIGFILSIFLYTFSKILLENIKISIIIKAIFMVMCVFPLFFIFRFIFLGLILNIIVFIYICFLIYNILSVEFNCRSSRIISVIIMSIISTAFVVILVFTKTVLFI
jgi:hypothetical protein